MIKTISTVCYMTPLSYFNTDIHILLYRYRYGPRVCVFMLYDPVMKSRCICMWNVGLCIKHVVECVAVRNCDCYNSRMVGELNE